MMSNRRRSVPTPTYEPLPEIRIPHPHVEVHPRLGVPVVEGTLIPVHRLFRWHRTGTTFDTLFRRYPMLGCARILDAVAFAYDNLDVMTACMTREDALLGSLK